MESEEEMSEAPLQTKGENEGGFASPITPPDNPGDGSDSYQSGLEHLSGMDLGGVQADVQQRKPVQRMRPIAIQRNTGSATPISAKAVVQRLAVQVHGSSGQESKIGEVQISGRPDSAFSDSMGDHTTAFAVHAEGIKKQLIGLTYTAGIQKMRTLAASLQTLPGYKLIPRIQDNSPHKVRLQRALLALTQLLSNAAPPSAATSTFGSASVSVASSHGESKAAPDESGSVSQLQGIIRMYLEARELIPLSTFNIRLKSASGGKGKGEGRYVDVLRNFKADQSSGPSPADAALAIERLFDVSSTSSVLVERNPMLLNAMAPGTVAMASNGAPTGGAPDPMAMLDLVWQQHLLSIRTSFPELDAITKHSQLVNKYKGSQTKAMLLQEAKMDLFYTLNQFDTGLHQIHIQLGYLSSVQQQAREAFAKKKAEGKLKGARGVKQYREINAAKNSCDELLPEIEKREKLCKGLGDKLGGAEVTKILQAQLNALWTKVNPIFRDDETGGEIQGEVKMVESSDGNEQLYNRLLASFGLQSGKKVKKKAEKAIAYKSVSNKSELQIARGNLGVQIECNASNVITSFISDGRTQSPFRNTMGAHTIAWIVHLDHVRAGIVGKTVDQALAFVNSTLLPFLNRLEASFDADNSRGNATQKGRRGALGKEIVKMGKFITAGKVPGPHLAYLQAFISNMLAYTNLIPGITYEANNTDGRGEGAARDALGQINGEVRQLVATAQAQSLLPLGANEKIQAVGRGYVGNLFGKADTARTNIRKLREPKGGTGAKVVQFQEEMINDIFPYLKLLFAAEKAVKAARAAAEAKAQAENASGSSKAPVPMDEVID